VKKTNILKILLILSKQVLRFGNCRGGFERAFL